MTELLVLFALAGPGPSVPTAVPDTIVAVRPGTSLTVETFSGRIRVRGWEQDEVEVLPSGGRRREAAFRAGTDRVVIRGQSRGERYSYDVRVPEWMSIDLQGTDLDVIVEGVDGAIRVQTIEGNVTVEGGSGGIDVRTVDGIVRVSSALGAVSAWSGDGNVILEDVSGTVWAESVDGDVVLDEVEGDMIRGSTVDGDVWFVGPIRGDTQIELVTHDGDIEVDPVGPIDAEVEVATFDGEFESDFPITLQRFGGGEDFNFTLGNGQARLVLQAFDGSIRLREPR